ncbi:Astacin (Peptidase family M12A) [Nitrosospira multiformis ATCC 25196]|uniref:Astacin (Peptidase family M12A) n=1 Tax=Nitrosospira multiformis (strain ATCC 25196 / NCIMB 11849 / C 71) TaxID=323848 RepID=Q2YCU8_NITMU|nr:hypothetical protein [Nitrosospira multiformis]ABB73423.1 hypothetical protein Nmul_A0114 [Nitrosospira multiformis ATCC 25196]SEG12024.1 Astacin (Peptidase family M12A) [Nitrosospira multiformis ATCC 25196]
MLNIFNFADCRSAIIRCNLVLIVFGLTNVAVAHDLPGLKSENLSNISDSTGLRNSTPAPDQISSDKDENSQLRNSERATLIAMKDQSHAIVIASALAREAGSQNIYGLTEADKKKVEAVILRAKTWDPGTIVKICFYEEGKTARPAIVEFAKTWTNHGNVKFDFGVAPAYRTCSPNESSNIRITFRTKGYWSLIGTDSMYRVSAPSMGLQDFDSRDPKDPEFATTVLHEFGHALGFHHEHQTPAADCEAQMDTGKIKQIYRWDDSEIKENFHRIEVSSLTGMKNGFKVGDSPDGKVAYTVYDPNSIMHYALPYIIFKQPLPKTGSCYIPPNRTLSKIDIAGMKEAYPNTDQASLTEQNRKIIKELMVDQRLTTIQRAAFSVLQK